MDFLSSTEHHLGGPRRKLHLALTQVYLKAKNSLLSEKYSGQSLIYYVMLFINRNYNTKCIVMKC